MFIYNYTVTENDYLAFNVHILEHTSQGRKNVWIFRGTFALIALMAVVILLIAGAEWPAVAITAVVLAIGTVVYGLSAKKQIMKSVEKQMCRAEKKGTPLYSKAGTITFGEADIQDDDGRMAVKLPYDSIHTVHVTPQALYIFLDPVHAILLPAHCVGGPHAVGELLVFLQTVIPAEKIVRLA